MTKETQVSANHGHIRSDGFQMRASLQDKFPPGCTANSPTALGDCGSAFPADRQGCSEPTSSHPSTPGNAQLVMGARPLPQSHSKPVKAGPDPQGRVFPPRPVLPACPRPPACATTSGRRTNGLNPLSPQQSSARGANQGSAFQVPHTGDGWGEGQERQLRSAPHSPVLGRRSEAVARAAAEDRLFCTVRLSSGCFYFQRELISSGCAGVWAFFSPPVTKSWKTLLNNISEHGWNKDRAQRESSHKTRDNQSCCCSFTSLPKAVSFGFPSWSGLCSLSPQQPPARQGCAQPRSPHCRGRQDLARASSARQGKELQGLRQKRSGLKALQEQPAGLDGMPGAKGACTGTRQGGRLRLRHCCRRG